jgi:hypothetical protein
MHEKPKLQCTKNYEIFEMDPINRDLSEKPVLLASMRAHGFMPSSPIHCTRSRGGKLRVVRGHHRLHYAKRLDLHVWYVVDDSNTDIYDLEGDSNSRWSLRDFLMSRAKAGNEHCQRVLEFQRKHGLPLGVAISLMGGHSAGSDNKQAQVKNGTFKVAGDLSHANAVVDIVDHCKSAGVPVATSAAFVVALSTVVRVPEFDAKVLKHRITLNPGLIEKRSSVDAYLDVLDAAYNYMAKAKRFPLKFRAKEIGRQRQATFGGKNEAARG